MAGRYRVAVITLLTVAGLALAGIIAIFVTLPSSKSSADLPAATHSLGTPDYTTRPTSPVKTPPARHQGRIFGVADPALLGETASQQKSDLAAMKAIGINSIRMDADWSQVQPDGPSSFDWGRLDQTVSSIMAAGMSADLIIDGCPQWAAADSSTSSAPTPASPAQYATYAAQVAARFTPVGVNDFEIWNEPNIAEFWQPSPNPQAYTAILKAAYAAIKKVVPSATVISGGLSPATTDGTNIAPIDFLKAMYAAGAKGSFDALGFHPYSFPATPDTYESWSAWSQMSETSPSVRSVMASYGDSGKKIWITEYGAPSSGPDGIGQAAQSASLTQAVYRARSTSWIGALYLYTWADDARQFASDRGDQYGLIIDGGTKKAAYYGLVSALKVAASGLLVRGDICDASLLARIVPGHDVVLNFAAETHVDRSIAGARTSWRPTSSACRFCSRPAWARRCAVSSRSPRTRCTGASPRARGPRAHSSSRTRPRRPAAVIPPASRTLGRASRGRFRTGQWLTEHVDQLRVRGESASR